MTDNTRPDFLWPFFCYYGGKWRSGKRYPEPRHNTVVEPFAGAAGYSLRHYTRDIILIEKDEILTSLWQYLIDATPAEIHQLPLWPDDAPESFTVDDFDVPTPAKHLIGFWLNKGNTHPCKRPSSWMRSNKRPNSYWGEAIRDRIASQVPHIKHWKAIHSSYRDAPDLEATWFIDPPYVNGGEHYNCSEVEYEYLSWWARHRRGQVIVCERPDAKWMDFTPLHVAKTTPGGTRTGKMREGVWLNTPRT